MRVVTLSDHTGDKLREARNQREADHARRVHMYEDAVRTFENTRAEKRAKVAVEWKAGRYGRALAASIAVVANLFDRRPVSPTMASASDQERVWEAGNEGEVAVLDALKHQLGDDWTVVAGYHNRKGEADLLLVGDLGVLGIEVKAVNGKVHVDGERWTRDKYDKYGNVVQTSVPITDKRGRSPAQQIGEVCGSLAQYLEQRGKSCTILTAVILVHPRASVGSVHNLRANFLGRIEDLDVRNLFVRARAQPVHGTTLVQAIGADHAYHQKRRTQARDTRPTASA
ncbi:NERD domain-containing protein [Dyella sp. C11]|uniref:NERD domain-containing protein n=1 Tax=Dyella sp. C11 TaxID=2126991 RepID=UPI000D64FA6D|nr:NERD domain-containing protein [Dyella sp. C11]